MESVASREILDHGAEDAATIRLSRQAGSTLSTADGASNFDIQLSVDEEIINCGPYLRQYRELLQKEMRARQMVRRKPLPSIQEAEVSGWHASPPLHPAAAAAAATGPKLEEAAVVVDIQNTGNYDAAQPQVPLRWAAQFSRKEWMVAYIACRTLLLTGVVWEMSWTAISISGSQRGVPAGLGWFLFVSVWSSIVLLIRLLLWRRRRVLRSVALGLAELFGLFNIAISALMASSSTGQGSQSCGLVSKPLTAWLDIILQGTPSGSYLHCPVADTVTFWVVLFLYACWAYIRIAQTERGLEPFLGVTILGKVLSIWKRAK